MHSRLVPAVVLVAFQSAPAIAGGRCPAALYAGAKQTKVSIRARHCWRAMPDDRHLCRAQAPVSIRARHCWRAMRSVSGRCGMRSMFQSAPAIAGGRCLALCGWNGASGIVSIRARHCWRAMLERDFQMNAQQLFQSAPAIAGGRCSAWCAWIHPRTCFNPRPPLLAGDAGATFKVERDFQMFQSAPAIAGGRCHWRPAQPLPPNQFQSAPAIAGGRCWRLTICVASRNRFNPRPPLLAGDAGAVRDRRAAFIVSIRARHCWRAMRVLVLPPLRASDGFNPRPPLLAGDASSRVGVRRGARRFNPRPPLLAGDA